MLAAEQEKSKVKGKGCFEWIKVKERNCCKCCVQIIEKFAVVLAAVDALELPCTLLQKSRGFRANRTGRARWAMHLDDEVEGTMKWRETSQKYST